MEIVPGLRKIKRAVLVADPNEDFLKTFSEEQNTSLSSNIEPVTARTGHLAQELLADPKRVFAGIFVNLDVENPNGLSVIRCAFYHRPATPIYVLQDEGYVPILSPEDLEKMGIRKLIQKPISYPEMLKLVAPLALSFNAEAVLEQARLLGDQELSSEDGDYVALRAETFLSGAKSLFDVYVRLTSGRYLKLLKAGDSFTADRIEGYLKKRVTHFYIKKQTQESYLQYCDHLISKMIKLDRVPMDVKVNQMLNLGEQTMTFLRNKGVEDSNLQYAAKFINNLEELVRQMDLDEKQEVKSFMQNVAAYEHGVGTAILACILARSIEVSLDKPLHIIGLASLLHDIGLYDLPEELWAEDELGMNFKQREQYQTHPHLGAEKLRKIGGIAPGALQAIEMHHVRKDGKGFPTQYRMVAVNKAAEIVGIADEFNAPIRKSQTDPSLNIEGYLEQLVFPGFTKQIVYAFRSCFLAPAKKKKLTN